MMSSTWHWFRGRGRSYASTALPRKRRIEMLCRKRGKMYVAGQKGFLRENHKNLSGTIRRDRGAGVRASTASSRYRVRRWRSPLLSLSSNNIFWQQKINNSSEPEYRLRTPIYGIYGTGISCYGIQIVRFTEVGAQNQMVWDRYTRYRVWPCVDLGTTEAQTETGNSHSWINLALVALTGIHHAPWLMTLSLTKTLVWANFTGHSIICTSLFRGVAWCTRDSWQCIVHGQDLYCLYRGFGVMAVWGGGKRVLILVTATRYSNQ